MQYKQLGTSDLMLPVVSFGAWAIGGWMWGGSDDEVAIRAIQTAIDVGITCIDTAPIYGMGHSESVVGKAIAGHRDDVILATKCGLRWDLEEGEFFLETQDNMGIQRKVYRNLHPESIRYECEQSLRRMKVDEIDLYQCHWPDATADLDDTMDILLTLQKEGKIRAIGVSNFTIEMIQQCLQRGSIASLQPKYNALERGVESELLPFCKANHIGVLAYSPIAQGLLTGAVTLDREFPEGDLRGTKPLFSHENRVKILAMLDKVRPIANGYHASLGQLFIAWLNQQPGMTSCLVGARNAEQVVENARAGNLQLSPAEITRIREAVEALDLAL